MPRLYFCLRLSLPLVIALAACSEKRTTKSRSASTARVAVVKTQKSKQVVNDKSGFCEKTFPATGPEARRFQWPALRALPGQGPETARAPKLGQGWTWVNLWATWCGPCMDEMPLLARWSKALASEDERIQLELLTIDGAQAEAKLAATISQGLPGPVRWMADEAKFPALLTDLGLDPHAAIPIHALVDPRGQLRCVRVGAIHALDFAAVKGIIKGG